MKVWLDDVRPPWKYGRVGWTWVKTAEETIGLLATGRVEAIDLDHDLSVEATLGQAAADELTGYDVLAWMEQNNVWPEEIAIHTLNPVGRDRMRAVLAKNGRG